MGVSLISGWWSTHTFYCKGPSIKLLQLKCTSGWYKDQPRNDKKMQRQRIQQSCREPPASLAEKSCVTINRRLHPATISPRCSSRSNRDHSWIQLETPTLLTITLFLHFQIDQHKTNTPICILGLVFLSILINQFPT
jgi:hypothetical protein